MSQHIATISSEYQEILEKVRDLVPRLRERSKEVQETRRIPQATIEELEEVGVFRLLVPKMYGGYQLDFRKYIEIVSEIGRGCGSTAWVSSIASIANWGINATFSEKVQREVFENNPNARACAVLDARKAIVKRVNGGYLIEEGLWGFGSGSLHAHFAVLGIPLVGEVGEQIGAGVALIPMEEIQIKDDWYTVSQRGTGSNTLLVHNVFVPDERISNIGAAVMNGLDPSENLKDVPLYRSEIIPSQAIVLAAPALGQARGAMEHFMSRLPDRKLMYTQYAKQDEAPVTHIQVAEAAMKIDSAQLHIYRAADDIDLWAKSGKRMDLHVRARIRMDTSYAIRNCYEAIEILMNAAGGSSVMEMNPLNQIASDIRSSVVHALTSPMTNLETYGRILCGKEPNTHMI